MVLNVNEIHEDKKTFPEVVFLKQTYRISSKDSAPPIFRHVQAEMRTKPPNFVKRFGSSS